MLEIKKGKQFKKDVKRIFKRGWDLSLLEIAIDKIANEELLEEEYKLHPLEPKNQIPKRWDVHIGGRNSDWVLVYYIHDGKVVFERTGSHADVFK